MLKLLLFYGGMFVAFLATVALWVFWRPKLIAQISTDTHNRVLRCTIQAARTFQRIRIPSKFTYWPSASNSARNC